MALGPRVANDLRSVWVHTPVTRCALRLVTSAGKPVGGDPISPTASAQTRQCPGSPPPALGLRYAQALEDAVCLCEHCPRGSLARVQKPPQGHQHLACDRHHPTTPQPLPTAPKPVLAPALKQAKAEIKRLNEELEQRVAEMLPVMLVCLR